MCILVEQRGLSAQQSSRPSTNVAEAVQQSASVSETSDVTANSPMDVDQQGSNYLV